MLSSTVDVVFELVNYVVMFVNQAMHTLGSS